MVQTAWNLGLYCFSSEKNEEGASLFNIINKLSHCYREMLFSETTKENRIFKFIMICAFMLTQYNKSEETTIDFKIDNDGLLTMFSLLKSTESFDPITAIISVFEMEIYNTQGHFDKALELFKAHEDMKDCPFPVLERMAGTNN